MKKSRPDILLNSRNFLFQPFLFLMWFTTIAIYSTAQAQVDPVAMQRFLDREAIEQTLSRANLGFELSDPDIFVSAFAEDGVYELDADVLPAYGYRQLIYTGRDEIRRIVDDRLESAASADPDSLSYDPDSLRRYNRNSNSYITLIDESTARHISNWMVTMKTNVDIHVSAIGRYEDELVKRNGEWLILKRTRIE